MGVSALGRRAGQPWPRRVSHPLAIMVLVTSTDVTDFPDQESEMSETDDPLGQMMAAMAAGDAAFLFAGVVAWTVGEAVLVPLPDVLIHEHVPPARAGASFGLAELRYVGFFLGPVVGGALLSHSSVLWFGVLAVVVLAAWPLLVAASRRIHPGKVS